MKTFDLPTKFGTVFFIVNGSNEIYVSSSKRVNFKDIFADITIRGKQHKNLHLRFGLKTDKTLDGRTYDFDGNTPCFVSDKEENDYFKVRAVYMSDSGSFSDSSHAAKKAIYDEIKEKLNQFYKNNKAEIDAEFASRAKEYHAAKIAEFESEIKELQEKLFNAQKELNNLMQNAPQS